MNKQQMKFVSRPYQQRIGLIPMAIAIVLVWILVVLAFVISGFVLQRYLFYGALLVLITCALAVYMGFLTHWWIQDSKLRYELFADGDLISLSTFDKDQNARVEQQLSLIDVTSAEYYPAQDTSTMLLRGKNNDLDIPLWAFGPDAERKIGAYVKSHGISVISTPGNVVI